MFDVLGVGLCIACISYLCCIYTTTFVSLSSPTKKCRTKKDKCHGKRNSVVVLWQGTPGTQQPQCTSSYTPTSYTPTSRKRCPCASVYCLNQKQPINVNSSAVQPKLCLVATSFFDFDTTDSENNNRGKRKRLDEGPSRCEVLRY